MVSALDVIQVIEINPQGKTVWRLEGFHFPRSVDRLPNGNTLVAVQYWVYEVNQSGAIGWTSPKGSEESQIWDPIDVEGLDNGDILITDKYLGKVVEFDRQNNLVWSISGLWDPRDAERLGNGNTLIAEAGPGRVIEVNSSGHIVWNYTLFRSPEPEEWEDRDPQDADRLPNGNTLITVSPKGNHRVIEVDPSGEIVWETERFLVTNPIDAERLLNGNTLIVDWGRQVIEVDIEGRFLRTVWKKEGCFPQDVESLPNGNILIAVLPEVFWPSAVGLLALTGLIHRTTRPRRGSGLTHATRGESTHYGTGWE
jgi:hypothetical protein